MKKSFLFSVAAVLFFAAGPLVAAFSDVPSSHTNAEAIEYVKEKNIVQGYSNGTFRADASINRAELTKIIVSALFTPEGNNCFPDVHNEWFAPYVCAGKARGIIGGYPDGTFKPEQNVSFAEAAKIISVAFKREISSGSSTWYEGYVRSLAEVSAIPVSITDFAKQLSRGEMAEIIYRLHAKITTKESASYENLADLPEIVSTASPSVSSSAALATVGYKPYPYTFAISPTWKTDWNFYIDTVSRQVKDEEGYNFLSALHIDNAERMEDLSGRFPEFLRVKFPVGSAGPYISHFYKKPLGGVVGRALGSMKPAESLHLTYFVRFPKDFDFSHSGILPALGGGITTSNYGAFGNEFLVGLYWTKKGEIGISGNFDIATPSETKRITDTKFTADGEWHRIDITANMNSIPVKRLNGVLKVQYNNTVIYNFNNIRFRFKANEMWDSLSLYVTNGDNISFQTTPKDMYLDLAGFTLDSDI